MAEGAVSLDDANSVEAVRGMFQDTEARRTSGWFAQLLATYLRHRTPTVVREGAANAPTRATAAIRRAAIQSAFSGASAGLASTGAALVTAQTEGLAAIVTVPVAALAIGSEMALRTLIHIDLICSMADIFEVPLDPTRPDDLWRICALVFGATEDEGSPRDPGKALVSELAHLEQKQVGEEIGHKVLGESVMRNVLPVVGIGLSAVTNYKKTRAIGDTARRYFRYQRAFDDVLSRAASTCADHHELLVEGVWFIFIADGRLTPEESACLASLVKKLDRSVHETVLGRFVEDEYDWLERVAAQVVGDARGPFFRALEVAAAVDKKVGLPERRLLRSAARRLGVEFDGRRLESMVKELEENGMLHHR